MAKVKSEKKVDLSENEKQNPQVEGSPGQIPNDDEIESNETAYFVGHGSVWDAGINGIIVQFPKQKNIDGRPVDDVLKVDDPRVIAKLRSMGYVEVYPGGKDEKGNIYYNRK